MTLEKQILDFYFNMPQDPRWVMQYKRKEKHKHIDTYLEIFEKVLRK